MSTQYSGLDRVALASTPSAVQGTGLGIVLNDFLNNRAGIVSASDIDQGDLIIFFAKCRNTP